MPTSIFDKDKLYVALAKGDSSLIPRVLETLKTENKSEGHKIVNDVVTSLLQKGELETAMTFSLEAQNYLHVDDFKKIESVVDRLYSNRYKDYLLAIKKSSSEEIKVKLEKIRMNELKSKVNAFKLRFALAKAKSHIISKVRAVTPRKTLPRPREK